MASSSTFVTRGVTIFGSSPVKGRIEARYPCTARRAMQLLFSGAIGSHPRPSDESKDEDLMWCCRVCGKENHVDDNVDDSESERCKCCGRERDPSWLLLEQGDLQLQIGTQVQMPDNQAFGPRVGVVLGIDFLRRRIQLLALSSKATSHATIGTQGGRVIKSASGRHSGLRFETIEYDAAQVQQLIPVSTESTDQVRELNAALQHHGVCGDCRRVFRIAQGLVDQKNNNQEAIRQLLDEIQRCSELKQQNIKLRYCDRVLANTATLKTLEQRFLEQKRTLEFLDEAYCPHCGWTARQEHRKRIRMEAK